MEAEGPLCDLAIAAAVLTNRAFKGGRALKGYAQELQAVCPIAAPF